VRAPKELKIDSLRAAQGGLPWAGGKMEIDSIAFGAASGIIYAVIVLIFAVCAKLGVYKKAAQMLQEFHMFFSLTTRGIILGMVEGGVMGFVLGLLFAILYNAFLG